MKAAAPAAIEALPIEGQRLFIRVDFNVPLTPSRGVADDSRIRASLPTIQHAMKRGARIVLGSHLGRPKKGPDATLSLEPVAARLAELIGQDVMLTDEPTGDGARKVVHDLRDGQVALLENLRFSPGEEANDDGFAKQLASYADVYVNDAFGTAHRAHASTVGMVKYFTKRGVGFLMQKEVEFLGKLLGNVDKPFAAIVGGAKVSDKLPVLENLLGRVSSFLIGGAMANTFLKAQGTDLGSSKVEIEKLGSAEAFLSRARQRGVKVLLPIDVVTASSLDATDGNLFPLDGKHPLARDQMALDIGPQTLALFAAELKQSKTIFWNGPMGVFEKKPFAAGTLGIAKTLAECKALTVVGGGDSVAALEQSGLANKMSHVSTGGGASLEFLEGQTLPGLAALMETP